MLPEFIESSCLRARRRSATYEALRKKLTDDIRELMTEQGVTFVQLAAWLGYTVSEMRERVKDVDLRLGQLVEILDVLDMEPYLMMTPRRWNKEI